MPSAAAAPRIASRIAVRVGEEQAALRSQDGDAGRDRVVRMALDVAVLIGRPGRQTERRDVRSRGAVDEQDDRHEDPEEQTGQRVEQEDPERRRHGRDEVRSSREPVDPPEPARVDAVEADQRPDVDQLDQGGDDDGGQGRLGQLLEEAGQEQQGDDGQGRDDQPRQLGARPGAGVHRGLRQAAVDDHAAGEPRLRRSPRPAPAARGSRRCRSGSGPRRSWPRRDPRRSPPARRPRPQARAAGSRARRRPARRTRAGRPGSGRRCRCPARRGAGARPRRCRSPRPRATPG